MALSHLVLRNLPKSLASSSSSSCLLSPRMFEFDRTVGASITKQKRWESEIFRRVLATTSENVSSDGKGVAVAEAEGDDKKFKLLPKNLSRRGGLWKNSATELSPFHLKNYLVPSGLGDALLKATENINKLFESLRHSRLLGRMKENNDFYKLRFEVPGLAKEDVKITIEDGLLIRIRGEHKEEDGDGSDDDVEHWSSISFGYYDTSLLLPDDAKVEEIKAEMKDGILTITIPRDESKRKNIKEINIQ